MKNITLLQIIGLAVGIVCFVWFLAPYAVAGVLNIGNITGIIVAALLIVYTAMMPTIHRAIKYLWKRKFARIPLVMIALFGILCAILVVVESACMISACAKQEIKDGTVVVLGCRVYGERASLSMVERLEAAYEYLNEHPGADCVVSGGQGDGENITEAECMYRWLVDKGIEPSRIYKEDASTSTIENIAFTKEVIEENGLNEKIVIVTNEYHIYRAGTIAKENDLVWSAKPAKTAGWLFPTFYVRELYGILEKWILK